MAFGEGLSPYWLLWLKKEETVGRKFKNTEPGYLFIRGWRWHRFSFLGLILYHDLLNYGNIFVMRNFTQRYLRMFIFC